MKLGLFGYGAMGQLVHARAADEGHEVAVTFTSRDAARNVDELTDSVRGLDVAIDFSTADRVLINVAACVQAGVPLVEGTTGWGERKEEVRRIVATHDGALIFSSNFSVGAQIFYRIVARAAELFQGLETYAPFIEEAHHARKRDAPSGTALQLRGLMASCLKREVPVASTRAGYIPGTHRAGFDSPADQVLLTHTARTREGFAAGALLAARWIRNRRGVYEFSEVFDEILGEGRDKA